MCSDDVENANRFVVFRNMSVFLGLYYDPEPDWVRVAAK